MKIIHAPCVFLLDVPDQWSYVPIISKGNQVRLREIRPMSKFKVGEMVISQSGKEYRVTNVFADSKIDPARGQRYGIERIRNGKVFGPFRNFYDNSGFRTLTPLAKQGATP